MEKRVWESPLTMVQRFEPNEYCSACGEENKVYKFKCDAGRYGTLLGYDVCANGADGIAGTSDDQFLGSYTPCDKTHEASTTDEFISGYMRKDWLIFQGRKIDVIIWRGEDGRNIHCTTNLQMETWETAKS